MLGFRDWLARTLHPFAAIAKELQIIRELYELELASRQPPIRRVTEAPSRWDTEVSYVGDPEKKADLFAVPDDDWEE